MVRAGASVYEPPFVTPIERSGVAVRTAVAVCCAKPTEVLGPVMETFGVFVNAKLSFVRVKLAM